jgi:hypothetical protein
MRLPRTLMALAAGAGLLLGGVGSPAEAVAPGGGTLVGTLHVNCFGCGASAGTASLKFTGVARGQRFVTAPVNLSFSFNSAVQTACIGAVGSGSYAGAIDGTFTMNFGPTVATEAVLSLQGDINGAGSLTAAVTTPKALLCGGMPLDADVSIAVAGD